MFDPLQGLAMQLHSKIENAKEKMIQEKLMGLVSKAMMENQMEVAAALYKVDTTSPIEVKRALEKAGFEIEVYSAAPQVKLDEDRYCVDLDPPKVIIYKKVLEL